jgi:hypothetical protein
MLRSEVGRRTDEQLCAISCRLRADADRVGPYRTATRDLDQAIDDARTHLRVPNRAAVVIRALATAQLPDEVRTRRS